MFSLLEYLEQYTASVVEGTPRIVKGFTHSHALQLPTLTDSPERGQNGFPESTLDMWDEMGRGLLQDHTDKQQRLSWVLCLMSDSGSRTLCSLLSAHR